MILIENYIMGEKYAGHKILERIFGDVLNEKIPFTK